MIFAVMGFFKDAVEAPPPELQAAFNEHVGQPILHLRLAGLLRGEGGRLTGAMVLMEADGFAAAQAYLDSSPYFHAGLYDRVEVAAYDIQVGRLH